MEIPVVAYIILIYEYHLTGQRKMCQVPVISAQQFWIYRHDSTVISILFTDALLSCNALGLFRDDNRGQSSLFDPALFATFDICLAISYEYYSMFE